MQLSFFDRQGKPFVQWAGGKRSMIKHIVERLPKDISCYHEPFVGGGAVFLSLKHLIKECSISDMNSDLITTYRVIRDDVDDLITELLKHAKSHKLDADYYEKVKEKLVVKDLEIASRFIYLNKTCYNGIYRINGDGKFYTNEDTRKRNKDIDFDIHNLTALSNILSNVYIGNGDFYHMLDAKSGDFVYMDPPYDDTDHRYTFPKFNKKDHIRLRNLVDELTHIGVNVMVSNSTTEFIKELYKHYYVEVIDVNNALSARQTKNMKRQELIICNYVH